MPGGKVLVRKLVASRLHGAIDDAGPNLDLAKRKDIATRIASVRLGEDLAHQMLNATRPDQLQQIKTVISKRLDKMDETSIVFDDAARQSFLAGLAAPQPKKSVARSVVNKRLDHEFLILRNKRDAPEKTRRVVAGMIAGLQLGDDVARQVLHARGIDQVNAAKAVVDERLAAKPASIVFDSTAEEAFLRGLPP